MILPITQTIAGAAALLNIWLAIRVGNVRQSQKVFVGDGGNDALIGRMRAQANFVEYTPFVLILLGLVELARGTNVWLWIVGVIYVVARILHAFGMDVSYSRATQQRLRGIGIGLTLATLLGLAVYALVIPYLAAGTITTDLIPAG
jgi:uncharacterized membrane protein YecN with MAPEG domain